MFLSVFCEQASGREAVRAAAQRTEVDLCSLMIDTIGTFGSHDDYKRAADQSDHHE